MKNRKVKVVEELKKHNRAKSADFVDIFRRLYNGLCRKCQVKVTTRIQKGEKNVYELLCDECRIKAKKIEKEANEAL